MQQSEVEGEERSPEVIVSNRAQVIRDACMELAEYDRQIDLLKAERKSVIDIRVVGDLGMKKSDFTLAYKLYQAGQDKRDTLFDTMRECFKALGLGEQLNWVEAAESAEPA